MKQQSTKHQEYTYTAQCVVGGGSSVVRTEAGFWVQPPENTISIEYLFVDIKVRFNANVPLDDCKITRIGIMHYSPLTGLPTENEKRWHDVDLQADANRELEVRMNLTSLLKKDFVSGDITTAENNVPFVNYPEDATYYDGLFLYPPNFIWWKQDALYTTVGQV